MTHAPHRTLAATIALTVLLTSCTGAAPELPATAPGDSVESTTSGAAPAAPPSPSPSPAGPTSQDAADALSNFLAVSLELPQVSRDQVLQVGTERLEQTTTAAGTAHEHLAERLELLASENRLVDRGTSEILITDGPTEQAPGVWDATACLALTYRPAPLDGPFIEGLQPLSSSYATTPFSLVASDDGGWLIDDYTPRFDDVISDPDATCVPPELEQVITRRWDALIERRAVWGASGQDRATFPPFRNLLTAAFAEAAAENIGTHTFVQDTDVFHGMEIDFAAPDKVVTVHCQDPSRDPAATITVNATGEQIPLGANPPAWQRLEWNLEDGNWRVDDWHIQLEGAAGGVRDHRCY